jgi:endonuclease/exonuclease/phosphatase family metal-dependent hydrolase
MLTNTHLDHVSEEARREGLKLVLNFLQDKKLPSIFTLDMNAEEGSKPFELVIQSKCLNYAKAISKDGHHGPHITSTGFRMNEGKSIDFIFVSNEISVVRHATLSDIRENYKGVAVFPPSDHRPVIADVFF